MKISTLPFYLAMTTIAMINADCKKEVADPPPVVWPSALTNRPPVVNAGPDITVAIPTTSANLALAVSDADFNLISVNCEKIAGPTSAHFDIGADWRSASAYWLEEGVYEVELTGTDKLGLIGRDTVRITVASSFPKYVKNGLLPDASYTTTVEIPEDVYKNLKWAYCRSSDRSEGIDKGPLQGIDYSWGGWYYELLANNKLFVVGGNPNEKFDLIIYY